MNRRLDTSIGNHRPQTIAMILKFTWAISVYLRNGVKNGSHIMNTASTLTSLFAAIGSVLLVAGTQAAHAYTPRTAVYGKSAAAAHASSDDARGYIQLAQYGSVRRVSRRTARRTTRRVSRRN